MSAEPAEHPAEHSDDLLDVRGLTVTYRTGGRPVPAVRGVDVTLRRGDTLGVAGESGSGKSTMALSLLRLLPPEAEIGGEVIFQGQDLLTAAWGKLRAVRWDGASVVFQGAMNALNPVRSVGEQIREPILLHQQATPREARARTARLLADVGLPAARAEAYPHELSGGQRQRAMIAMALACEPDLIIADEPTTALDVIVQAQILTLLTDLVTDSRIGLIMISHDLSVLADTCDRLAVMYAGQIVELGPSAQVMAEPRHPYTRALSGAFPTIGDPASRLAPTGLPGNPPDPRDLDATCAFRPRCAVALARCETEVVELWPAGPDRSSACVRVRPDVAGDLEDPGGSR